MSPHAKPATLIFALLFVLASVVLLSQLGTQTIWSSGKHLTAQPRFWPSVGLIMMLGFGGLHLWQTRSTPRAGSLGEVILWLRGLEYVAWFIGYVFLVPILGYLPASILIAVALVLRLGLWSLRWIGFAILLAFGIVVVFRVLLRVNVPGGAVYHWLPSGLSNFMLTYF